MSLIIFEGPDGAGKTTLADAWQRRLTNRIDIVQRRNHGPYLGEVDIAGHYLDDLVLALMLRNAPGAMFMDRSWISEAIYGPVARQCNRIGVPQRRALERVALGACAQVVLCLPPYERCKAAYLARKELEYLPDESQLKRVYDAFKALQTDQLFAASWCALPVNFYDWTQEEHRGSYIEMMEHDAQGQHINMGPGVGRFAPGEVTLLVGEQISDGTAAADLPFISWHPGGCSGWLANQLETWGVSERDLYWINAKDQAGKITKPGIWLDELRPKRVVAMGEVARTWCRYYNIEYRHITHPQYHKRFHHSEPYLLQELLT